MDSQLYDRTQAVQGALFQAALKARELTEKDPLPQAPPLFQVKRGYAEAPAWMLVQAMEFDPDPITVENLRRRAVWSAPRMIRALLDVMASEKWLIRTGEQYVLGDAGREIINSRMTLTHDLLNKLTPLDSVPELAELMESIIAACLGSDLDTWCLAHSRNVSPPEDASAALRVITVGSDLNAFRDDAHMAASTTRLGVDGYVWEAFAQLPGLATAEAIFDKFYYRGHNQEEYTDALQQVTKLGWAQTADGETYSITDEGQAVRDETERLTNLYFYSAWEDQVPDLIEALDRVFAACEAFMANDG